MLNTEAHDAWVHATFGIHPGSYGSAKGGKPKPAGQVFAEKHAATITSLRTAADRIVPAGPAITARDTVNAALKAMDDAIKANDAKAAQAAMLSAIKPAKIVMAAPDPAMLPVKAGKHDDEVLFAAGPGEKNTVSEEDIHQSDHLGDCFLLSSIGEIARIDPNAIKHMIHDNTNGTYTVTLHQAKTGFGYLIGKLTGQEFEDVKVTVDGNFAPSTVNGAKGDDEVGGKKEIWLQVLEKAYAKLHGGYDKIQGGNPTDAMEALTGQKAVSLATGKVTLAELQADLKSGKPVVMDTPEADDGTLPFGLYGGHAYMLEAIVAGPKGEPMIKLKNPWGVSNPSLIPFLKLGKGIEEIDVGGKL